MSSACLSKTILWALARVPDNMMLAGRTGLIDNLNGRLKQSYHNILALLLILSLGDHPSTYHE
jgi:hypothetical protein